MSPRPGEVRIVTPSQNHGEWARLLRARAHELVAAAGGAVRYPRACAAVLVALAAHAATDGTCHPSQATIAAAVRYSPRHVERALDDAERAGLLTRAVPRYGARVLGATTHYALPWWATAAREGLRGVARVQRELPLATDAQAAAVARALRETRPGALLGAVVRCLPGEAAVAVLRSGVDVMLPRRPSPRRPAPIPPHVAAAQLADVAALREIAAAVEGGGGPALRRNSDDTVSRRDFPERCSRDIGRAFGRSGTARRLDGAPDFAARGEDRGPRASLASLLTTSDGSHRTRSLATTAAPGRPFSFLGFSPDHRSGDIEET